ncbi:MAG TPA: EamA family transporter RarD [Candidatus Aminicenantes bacterium]|nr:EamA family transporter RarD [Candidatus Aminicenantes bacterium]
MKTGSNEKAAGIWAVAAAYVSWGLLPLFWRLLDQIPAQKIIAHRIVWSFAFLFILVFFQERWLEIKKIFSSKKTRTTLSLTSLILGMNWFVYIWAVNSGHVVEASLGYFINPLVSVLLGVLFLKEKLNFWQEISVFLAFIGVLYRAVDIGNIPWISLSLALTFGFYGFFKKKVNADSIAGLTAEMILLFPLAFVFIILMNIKNMGVIGKVSFPLFMLLLCTGIVTSLPLLCFNYGVKKIELKTVGFLQYLSPTFQFFLGVFVFKEAFTLDHMVSFALIWAALIIYSISHTSFMRKYNGPGR